MSIEINERTIAVWAVSFMKEDNMDWLAGAWETDDEYIAMYRFRYYVDDKTFDSNDKKNWYKMTVKKETVSKEKFIQTMQEVVRILWTGGGGKRYEIFMENGDVKQLMNKMAKWPFITMKTIDEKKLI